MIMRSHLQAGQFDRSQIVATQGTNEKQARSACYVARTSLLIVAAYSR
jgi:hypothetical protein